MKGFLYNKNFVLIFIMFVILIVSMTISIAVGTISIDLSNIFHVLLNSPGSKDEIVIYELRFPRILLAAVIGANLAVAGALMQCLTRNPLADPKIMGVSAGASVVVVFISFLNVTLSPYIYSPLIFLGAAIGGSLVYFLSMTRQASIAKIILAGVAISGFLQALSIGLLVLLGDNASVIYAWIAGSLGGVGWYEFKLILPASLISLVVSILITNHMNIFSLGEESAKGLGINLKFVRTILCLLVIVLAGSAVCVSGAIGFLGLIIPHIVKKMFGLDYKIVVPVCALLGAVILVIADLFSRTVLSPQEIPVGVVTAFLGCPFFLYLIRNQERKVT